MPLAAATLILSTMLAAAPQSGSGDSPSSATPPSTQGTSDGTPTPSGTDRPHEVGLGGFGGAGGGPSFRYFLRDRLGVEMNVGWSRAGYGAPGQGTTFRAVPSVVLMLNNARAMADVDVRPYVGGGINYMHTSVPFSTLTGQVSQGGVGQQVFGGVELTFAAARSLAISGEVRYFRLAVPTYAANIASSTDFYLLFHYYLK